MGMTKVNITMEKPNKQFTDNQSILSFGYFYAGEEPPEKLLNVIDLGSRRDLQGFNIVNNTFFFSEVQALRLPFLK